MKNYLSQKQINKIILAWEREFPVNEWQIQGIDIWPIVRIKLYIFLLNLGADKPKLNSAHSLTNRKPSTVERLIKVPGSMINSLAVLYQFYKKLEPKKIIFFGSHFHRTLDNGVYFNRFFDPMVHEHQLQDEVYMIEFEKVLKENYNQKAIVGLHKYLDQYKYVKKFMGKFRSPEEVGISLNKYQVFFDAVTRDFPDAGKLNITAKGLKRWAYKLNSSKGFFINFYKRTRPEKIIFLSYYGYDDMAAAILAAHELGIKTIDFQHGPQTNVHMAYSSWTKHPVKPYNIMPLEYWTWDQKSKENIEEWAQKTEFIQAKEVGHPYLAYFKKKILYKDIGEKIFFSLQTFNLKEMFPAAILGLMKTSELKWILRMHPRSNYTKKDLKFFLIKNKVDNYIYEIENALDTPLPKSLAGAKLHITNFSGCVIEAGMLNIPSLLIHESGKEIFRAYIDDKSVFYLNPNDPGFKDSFKNILDKLPKKIKEIEIHEIPNPLG